ncbi:MAG TPA: LysM peptidoglycan-binding domain-containing protein, partial [Usitatibacter sp.]|nr:LysM peptidoglycan-binding domain-containing protein [Usitatibacter sp.]
NKAVASGTGTLIVPVDKADDFRANLEKYKQPLVSWTEYQARRGESLDAIAKKHHATVAQLKLANGEIKLDKKGHLRTAGSVMVPMKQDPVVAVKVAQASAIQARETRVAAPVRETTTAKVYTVRSGDTLYNIAQRYRTTVDTLLGLNRLATGVMIQPGLKLHLP